MSNTQIGQLSANNFQLALDTSKLKMTFDDEFKELDSSPNGEHGWQTRFPGPAVYPWLLRTLPANHEIEYYSDSSIGVNPFSVSNGVLTITAKPAIGPGVDTPAGSYLYYTSGVITTYHSFSQLYGYFEVRAELPSGKGFWPAFWLLPADNSWPPELDVFEQLGGTPDLIYHTLHSSRTVGAQFVTTVPTATTAYHTYGVDWEPTTITWYVDGTAVATAATPASMHKPMYMLVNLGVGGAGSMPGAADLVSSAAYHIDYVRAYSSSTTPSSGPVYVSGDGVTGTVDLTKFDTGGGVHYSAGTGDKVIEAGASKVYIDLGSGSDKVHLGGGAGTVNFGSGVSRVAAGSGAETFIFDGHVSRPATGANTILYFDEAEGSSPHDTIQLQSFEAGSHLVFQGYASPTSHQQQIYNVVNAGGHIDATFSVAVQLNHDGTYHHLGSGDVLFV